jgi:hypothetical protein
LMAVQVLCEILDRYDLPCHFLVQHIFTPFKSTARRALWPLGSSGGLVTLKIPLPRSKAIIRSEIADLELPQ